MRILIADDHALVRAGIALMLREFYEGVEIVEASDLGSTAAAIDHEMPDVVLLDLAMPGMERFEGLTRLLERWPGLKIVMLSAYAGSNEVRTALSLGARGYIPKASGASVVYHAIDLVQAGERFVPASVIPDVESEAAGGPGLLDQLTERQRQTLALVMQGRSNKEIARDLGVIESTVKTHLKVILRKLGANNRTHAARIASDLGMRAQPGSGATQ